MALRLPEMCFWLAKTRKNLKLLRGIHVFDLVLKFCSDVNERNWLQILFYFIVLMGIVASVTGMSFFHLFHVLGWSCLALQRHRNVLNWNPKLIWSQMYWFLFSLLVYASFRRLRLMSFSNALKLYFLCLCVFPSSFPGSNDWFLTPLHYLQTQVTFPAVRR